MIPRAKTEYVYEGSDNEESSQYKVYYDIYANF